RAVPRRGVDRLRGDGGRARPSHALGLERAGRGIRGEASFLDLRGVMSPRPDAPLVTTAADDALVVVKEEPFNAEVAPSALASPIPPAGAHYVRAHFGPPPLLDARTHRVSVEGAVAQPQPWSLAALRALPQRSVTATMECAGNQRALYVPLPPGEPWLA